jgi:hypothetical protein
MKTALFFFLMVVSTIFNISLSQAQTDTKEEKVITNRLRNESSAGYPREFTYWLSAGVGGSSYGFSGGLSISAQSGRSMLSIRYISSSRYGEGWLGGYTSSENVWDISPLYGFIAKGKWGYASVSGGIGLVGGTKHGQYLGSANWINTYEKVPLTTIGIPLEAQLFFTPFSAFGIGVNGFANLNPKRSYSGILICLQWGKLR